MARVAINDEGVFPSEALGFTGVGISEYIVYNNTGSTIKVDMAYDGNSFGITVVDKRGRVEDSVTSVTLGEKEVVHLIIAHSDAGTNTIIFSGEAAHRGPISSGMRHNLSDLAISGLFIGQVA